MKNELVKEQHDTEVYLALIAYIREVSWITVDKVAEAIIHNEMMPDLLKFTIATSHSEIMQELTWILVNISSIDSEEVIFELIDWNRNGNYDVVAYLIDMALQPLPVVKENSIWALANLCQEDDQRIIDTVVNSLILNEISSIINMTNARVGLLRQVAFLMARLMKYSHKSKDMIEMSIEILTSILFITDIDVVIDCCHAFMNLTSICGK